MKIMGLHCGRSSIRGLVCNHNGRILNTARMAVSAENGAIPYIQNIQSLINTLAQPNAGIDCVGIVASGQISPQSGLVTKTVIPGFLGTDLRALVQSVLDTEVYVENCANAALIGEHWLGAAKKYRDVVLIRLSSEVGFAAMIDGQLQPDAAADRARLLLSLPDSGAAITADSLSHHLEQALGHSACFEEYQELYRKGHPGITVVIREFAARLAEALCHVDELKKPEIILVSGELAVWFESLYPLLKTEMAARGICVPVREGLLGADAAPLGSVRLCLDHFKKQETVSTGGPDRQRSVMQAAHSTTMNGPTRL